MSKPLAPQTWIQLDDLAIAVVRKPIKHLYFRVYPPDGRIQVTVPLHCREADLLPLLQRKQTWLTEQQAKVRSRPTALQLISGEIHYLWGIPYQLQVQPHTSKRSLHFDHAAKVLTLQTEPNDSCSDRERLLHQWYRQQLQTQIPPLLDHWQPKLKVTAAEWRIKRMKTRWGSCNIRDRRIWLNLELAKYPLHCLESVVVHELVHLLEHHHTPRFYQLLDQFLPTWRVSSDRLKYPPAFP
ncbi:M48 family metallopeptidase [Synechococcus elongatus]|uniref:M48 family metallopeptidase n=1 Tax=Synechococcus elongatus TaxID=32046 RepID=UPI000F7D5AA7|nr:SprT family zinc-dependent metalloprotease [Synechococcus elongatus]